MTGQIVTRADGGVLDPSGCGVCGINERGHFQRWASGLGWHRWTEPTSEQRLERMLARRAARNTTPETTQVLADATTRTHHNIPKEGLMTNTQLTENDQRAAYIDGLRQIADFLEENPDVELPHLASSSTGKYEDAMHIYLVDGDQKEKLATVARAMGRAEKVMDDDRVRVFRRFAGIALVAQASRDQVCERVVTGVDEVEVEERDPDAVAAAMATVPAVKVVKKVEIVEWVCSPLLAAEKAGAVA